MKEAATDNEKEKERIGSSQQILRSEYVRLVEQALLHLGFDGLSKELEAASGTPLMQPEAFLFRQAVLDERWDDAVGILGNLPLANKQGHQKACFLLLQEKFLKQVSDQNTVAALKTLRKELAPLGVKQEQLHRLAGFLMAPGRSAAPLPAGSSSQGGGGAGRRVLADLTELIPVDVLPPEHRLEELVEQSLEEQMSQCLVRMSAKEAPLSLLADLNLGEGPVPAKTITWLKTHRDEVWHLQFSHDGCRLASASRDKTAIIWTVEEGGQVQHLRTLKGHNDCVAFLAWSPDDALLATASHDSTLRLWNPETGVCVIECVKHTAPVNTAAWLPDGLRIVTGSLDNTLVLWDTKGNNLDSFQDKKVEHIEVSRDGSHLICASEHRILIINVETHAESVVGRPEEAIMACCLSADGHHLLCTTTNPSRVCLAMWDIGAHLDGSASGGGNGRQRSQQEPVAQYSAGSHSSVSGRFVVRACFGGPHEELVISGFEDTKVHIWQRGTGEHLVALEGHCGTVNCVAWHPSHPCLLASASDDHTIRIWGPDDPE